jgi:LuxR family transcriptional regulator, maltose regulon positive regulatory protein
VPRRVPQLAKLSRPRLYDAVPRERLFRVLDEKRKHPAIWVSGPPGAGKTVLVASYVEARDLPLVWFHVDPGDADLSTFFFFLAEAARPFSARLKPLPLLTPEYLPEISGFARRFFREFFARMKDGGVLVFDNVHDASIDNRFGEVIIEAIADVPAELTLVFISRSDPPAALSDCVARESLVTIGWDDLRLTLDETAAIVSARGVDVESAKLLHQHAQGWAAGLTLTIERLSRQRASGLALGTATRDATFEYFATQLFDAAAPRERELLMKTSLFTTFTVELATVLTNDEQARSILGELCRRQLFIYRKGGTEDRYQYHDLFREFLQSRLATARPQPELAALQTEAARLLVQHGAPEQAVSLLMDARQWDEASGLIQDLAPGLLSQGRWQTLKEWLRALPTPTMAGGSWLQYWLGCVRINEGVSAARGHFEEAHLAFTAQGQALGQLLAAAWIVRTYYIEYENFQPLDQWTEKITKLLAEGYVFTEPAHELHVLGALMIVFTYRQLAHPMAEKVVNRLTGLLSTAIDANLRLGAATGLMIYHTLAMEPAKARAIVDLMDPILNLPEVTPLNQAWWWMFVGYQHHRAGNRGLVEKALATSDGVAAANGLKQTAFFSNCFRAYYAGAWRDFGTARASVSRLEGTFGDHQPMHAAQFHLASCFVAMGTGDIGGAARHARIAVEATTRLGAPFFYVAWRPQCAPAVAMAGEAALADKWLEEAWTASEGTFMARYRPAILQARAYCAMLDGNRDAAREFLKQSIETGKAFNAWPYARGAVPMFDWMIREALESGIEVPYIRDYVRRYQVPPPVNDVSDWPWRVKVYTLVEFRIEVEGEQLVFSRKAPKKPLQLLKAIVAFGGRNVPEQRLMDALWPDDGGDASHEALAVALHRLRKLLGHAEAIQLVEGTVSLNRDLCWVDAWTFEALREKLQSEASDDLVDRLCALYQGHFLAEEADAPWAVGMRERLRDHFLQVLTDAARRLESQSRCEEAERLYRRGIDADDLAETFYQGAIRCLLAMGRQAEAMALLRRLRQTLSVTLGIKPSPQTENLVRSFQP